MSWQTIADFLEQLTGIQGLILITIPLAVYRWIANILRNERAPKLLQLLTGGTTVFRRYSEALSGFVNFLTPFFYSKDNGAPRFRGVVSVYSTFLAIALGYTVSLFFLGWSLTGEANVGNISLIKPYPLAPRILIAFGWLLLGVLAFYAVNNYQDAQGKLETLAKKYYLPPPHFTLAFIGGAIVFGSQYVSRDRDFGFEPNVILYGQTILGVLAFIAIISTERYLIGFTYVASACYGLALGVPILIGIPLAVAIATANKIGNAPILISEAAACQHPSHRVGYLICGTCAPEKRDALSA